MIERGFWKGWKEKFKPRQGQEQYRSYIYIFSDVEAAFL